MNDDLTLRQAADTLYALLRAALEEPSEQNQDTFLLVLRHYLLHGLRIQITREAVIVSYHQAELAHKSPEVTSCFS